MFCYLNISETANEIQKAMFFVNPKERKSSPIIWTFSLFESSVDSEISSMSLLLLLLLLSNTIFVFGGHENCPTNALKNILEKQTPEVTVVERHKNVSSSSTKFR